MKKSLLTLFAILLATLANAQISFTPSMKQTAPDEITIYFTGTTEQWKAIEKGFAWIDATPSTLKIICTNGELSKSEA